MQKLYRGVQEKTAVESPDHVMLQEVLLGGHLYLQLIKDKLLNWLTTVQYLIIRKAKLDSSGTIKQSKNDFFILIASICLSSSVFDF